jgi:hypothetical protein
LANEVKHQEDLNALGVQCDFLIAQPVRLLTGPDKRAAELMDVRPEALTDSTLVAPHERGHMEAERCARNLGELAEHVGQLRGADLALARDGLTASQIGGGRVLLDRSGDSVDDADDLRGRGAARG